MQESSERSKKTAEDVLFNRDLHHQALREILFDHDQFTVPDCRPLLASFKEFEGRYGKEEIKASVAELTHEGNAVRDWRPLHAVLIDKLDFLAFARLHLHDKITAI